MPVRRLHPALVQAYGAAAFVDGRGPYAADPDQTLGRQHAEPLAQARTEFQRDRDRIVHSTAFRRLEYKTQVFVNHEGDLFRTRLTHSIEVAQIGRSVARNLGLDEDLVEAVSYAHDLGHTPFGHAGQDALNECMKPYGGFEHNLQSLRIVDALEERYGAFDGLNLCFETREGILKHCSATHARELGEIGRRFLENRQPSLEAQLCNVADEIAYNNHDIDDGVRSGLISVAQLESLDLFARHARSVRADYPAINERRLVYETVRRMINSLVVDLIDTSAAAMVASRPMGIEAVRSGPPALRFSSGMRDESLQLKRFLRSNLYQHWQVNRMTAKARRIVKELFDAFLAEPQLLPDQYQARAGRDAPHAAARAIADYIAGMTDRYAIREYRRLFSVGEVSEH